ncbi:hypothetical protein A2X44_03810 [candidate division CPR3 bacterium GWF2_35_18]|uniref:Uncharacterized protein n=1 Tax=candidate division CPR3 bacterium GW2011_GWF2_35_18 TaxID=1618350 RepID=A0A0G0BJK2_UNCC3|nr:MAG: hypothetical protein UR67_C0004G0051 [candidate division CPR3 bacterium GW2011_GWF2_35_18]OGB63137.1 MAG: hypothetical protein A2X44_03810 [candidate division CPR3 bacterium GWF2_35_18]OGB64049.1 MAG: hypothetical protein A2250_04580 [candidate division CPR3 bacterium RIFOXYA2_FULL_35_13]OGB76042.1 MAG: hypothetical protein A2476_04420 [candidate division CPR3 bacterium RIFOXYC2_FULL_35_7]OGB78246.1 MAG: hypothetical protein A2296_01740 [candidate division CPR3 bacterium RIFOXYB2_FULL_3
MKNKKLLFVILFLLLLIIFFLIYFFFFKNKNSSPSSSNETNSNTNILTDNYIKCDIDNRKDVYHKMIIVNSFVDATTKRESILLMAGEDVENGGTPHSLQVAIPANSVSSYTQTKAESNVGISYGDGVSKSFGTDFDNGDSFKVDVTKFNGSNIEGTFSGEVTEINSNGSVPDSRITIENCYFKSSMEIKLL